MPYYKGSWYSQAPAFGWFDKEDRPGSNALGVPDAYQGIALPSRATLGKWFNVTPPGGGIPYPFQQTDVGPSKWTGRDTDISAAAAHQMGYTPQNFPTDAPFKIEPRDEPRGLGSPAGLPVQAGDLPDNATGGDAYASASVPARKSMPSSLADMFQPRSLASNEPIGFGDALQQRSNSLIGLGLGLMSAPGTANALQGYQAGSEQDAAQAYRQQALRERQAERAQAQANLQITDAQRAMKDVLGPGATPEQKAEFMKNYYASKTDPGTYVLKDVIDPRDPTGETKITVQEHTRTGHVKPVELPGMTGTAGPAVDWSTGAANAPVYGQGAGGYSQPPAAAASARPQRAITMPNGQVITAPPGLSKKGRDAWETHTAQTAADVAAGKMTEAQGTSNLYAGKMAISHDAMTPELEKQGLDAYQNRLEKYGGWAGNVVLMDKNYQKYRDAKDTFLNAYLRRISGATVHDAEYLREEKVFFPQPGDPPEQLEYKRRLRADAIQRMKAQVGMGYQEPPAPPGQRAPAAAGGGIPPPPAGFNVVQ